MSNDQSKPQGEPDDNRIAHEADTPSGLPPMPEPAVKHSQEDPRIVSRRGS